MKIIKIYSSWNQLKLKARAGHYNTKAHVRIWVQGRWELSEGRGGSKTEKATQNIHWRKMCPRPSVWSELGTGQAGGQWLGYQCLHQECVSNSRATITITTLTALQVLPGQPGARSDKHHQVKPEAAAWRPRGDGSISGQCECEARLGVSICSGNLRQKSSGAWHQSPRVWCHEAGVMWCEVWPGGGGRSSRGQQRIVWDDPRDDCDDTGQICGHNGWW